MKYFGTKLNHQLTLQIGAFFQNLKKFISAAQVRNL